MSVRWNKKSLGWIACCTIALLLCCWSLADAKKHGTSDARESKISTKHESSKSKSTKKSKGRHKKSQEDESDSSSKKHIKGKKNETVKHSGTKKKSRDDDDDEITQKHKKSRKSRHNLKKHSSRNQDDEQPVRHKTRKPAERPEESSREATKGYDIAYMWSKDIDSVLDYKDELENSLDDNAIKKLKIVRRGGEYGVICDTNFSEMQVQKDLKRQNNILKKSGLLTAMVVRDEGYSQLFNITYARGKNINSLKEKYQKVYNILGENIGRRLLVERTGPSNYALVYKLQDKKEAATELADKHAEQLKALNIVTSIIPEENNEIVYGESSHLDDFEEVVAKENALRKSKTETKNDQDIQGKNRKEVSEVGTDKSKDDKDAQRKTGFSVAKDTAMSRSVVNLLQELRQKGEIERDERTAFAVYDLENDQSLVAINTEEQFQAASMIKPFVGLAFFHQVKQGKLNYTEKARHMMEAMIQHSNNNATNWIMKQVGGPQKCEQILRQFYSDIFHRVSIVEYIPPGGKTYRNSALPSDYIRFLSALWNRELPSGKEMRRVMALPGPDRIYYGTDIPHGTLVYNKTGTTSKLCGDMGILVPHLRNGQPFAYAIVGIVERNSKAEDYSDWMRNRGDVIRQVSSLVYAEMKKIRAL